MHVRNIETWLYFFVLVSAFLLSAFSTVEAKVSILPRLQEIEGVRGQRRPFDLRLANHGEEPLHFEMKARALGIGPEGVPFVQPDSVGSNCAGWITFDPQEFTVGPDEKRFVKCSLSIPKDANGGYGAFIAAEYRIQQKEFTFDIDGAHETTFDIGMAAASMLLVSVRGSSNKVALVPEPFEIDSGQNSGAQSFLEKSGEDFAWTLELPVRNDGNLHTVVKGEVRIYQPGPRIVDSSELESGLGYIMGGGRRILLGRGSRTLEDGTYLARITLHQRAGRPIQGMFPFHVLAGDATFGEPNEEIKEIIEGLSPKLGLSQSLLSFTVSPRARRRGGVRITNHTADSLVVYPKVSTWALDASGEVTFDVPGVQTRSCADWISVQPDSLVIPPRKAITARVTLSAPEDLVGEYVAAVSFLEKGLVTRMISSEMRLPRTLMVLARDQRSEKHGAVISEVATTPVGPLNRFVDVEVGNTGNVHCYAEGKVTVLDRDWNILIDAVEFGAENAIILPGKTRRFRIACPGALDTGRYKVVVQVRYTEGAEEIVREHWFDQSEQ